MADNTYKATTWQIKFKLEETMGGGSSVYKLRIALASANQAILEIRVNDDNATKNPPLFTTGLIGKDNAIARHGIHGLYWLFNVEIQSKLLLPPGNSNTIYFTQSNVTSPFQGLMYDYIRLEAPPPSHSSL